MSADLPDFAKLASTVVHAPGLFLSRPKGARDELMKLNYQVGALLYRFVGPQLGPVELRVLQGLNALAGPQNRKPAALPPEAEGANRVLALLRSRAIVRTSYNELARAIGYAPNSGSAHAAIRRALERLFSLAVFVSRADEAGSKDFSAGHLFARLHSKESGRTIEVDLCPILAAAVMGGPGEYLRLSLDEVRRLKTDVARLLHHRLHWINAGQERPVLLDTLVGYVWPPEEIALSAPK